MLWILIKFVIIHKICVQQLLMHPSFIKLYSELPTFIKCYQRFHSVETWSKTGISEVWNLIKMLQGYKMLSQRFKSKLLIEVSLMNIRSNSVRYYFRDVQSISKFTQIKSVQILMWIKKYVFLKFSLISISTSSGIDICYYYEKITGPCSLLS